MSGKLKNQSGDSQLAGSSILPGASSSPKSMTVGEKIQWGHLSVPEMSLD